MRRASRAVLRAAALAASLACASALAAASPEVQLCLTHLRPGEQARAEAVLGPLHALPLYLAELEVDPVRRTVRGEVRLEYRRTSGSPVLYLRATPNAFEGASVKLTRVTVNGEVVKVQRPEPSLFEVPLPQGVQTQVTVTMELEARAPRGEEAAPLMGGLSGGMNSSSGRTDHGAFAGTSDFLSLVGVLPVMPHLDPRGQPQEEPAGLGDLAAHDPANYLVSISVPAGYRVHATGAALGEVPDRTGRVRFAFAAAAVRDFPVFVSRGYEVQARDVGEVRVESHHSAGSAVAAKKALGYAAAALREVQRRLGPYPFRVFRVVEAPLEGTAGGMEFPGLVTVSRSLYRGVQDPRSVAGGKALADLAEAMSAQGLPGLGLPDLGPMLERTLEFTVAHELGHQYFAGLVGSDPIANPVTDEALTQYTAVLLLEWMHGPKVAGEVVQGQLVASYQLFRLQGGEDGAADRPTEAFDGEAQYAALVYGKAPLLHRAERQLLGDEAFLEGLREYVSEYRYRWACGDCFTRTLARLNPNRAKELRLLRRRWWEEPHGDEDLGAPDLAQMMRQATGGAIPPEVLELLDELLPTLSGP